MMGLHTYRADDATIGWYTSYFGQLIGATLVEFRMEKDEYQAGVWWPVYTVRMPDGHLREIWLSQDEEGNGPGWLDGMPLPPGVGEAA